jgi:hypothetical protein
LTHCFDSSAALSFQLLDTIEKLFKCMLWDLNVANVALVHDVTWYPKNAAVETFIEKTKARSIVKKNLCRVAISSKKHIQSAAVRLVTHRLSDMPRKTIESASHVDSDHRNKYFNASRYHTDLFNV